MSVFPRIVSTALILLSFLWVSASQAALDPLTFADDLNTLSVQGNDLLVEISSVSLNSFNMTSELSAVKTAVDSFQVNVTAVFDSVLAASGTSMSLSDDILLSLQNLATVSASLANGVLLLSEQIVALSAVTSASVIATSSYDILRLSDDIGTMADRILEMADKILIMADNIGIMADRIIATQLIQNTNIGLVNNTTLETQRNAITLIGLFA